MENDGLENRCSSVSKECLVKMLGLRRKSVLTVKEIKLLYEEPQKRNLLIK